MKRVLITIEGGCVQWVAATAPVTVVVFDYDAREAGGEARHEFEADVVDADEFERISHNPDNDPEHPQQPEKTPSTVTSRFLKSMPPEG